MNIKKATETMKADSYKMASLSEDVRNNILAKVRESLLENADIIFEANQTDLKNAEEAGIASSVMKRLKFDQSKLSDVTLGIENLIALPDPVGKLLFSRELDAGLTLSKVSCPIGVIGIIFEARPDALVQISSLCIKSGNCAILKGGKETANTNKLLFDIIYEAAISAGAPAGCLFQASAHSEIDELLSCDETVDLLIPRGSNAFVQHIMNNTKIPVMGHADGICHTYVDKDADFDKAVPVVVDAKTQYTAACNATETLLIHRDIAKDFLPRIASALREKGVALRGTDEVSSILSGMEVSTMQGEDFATEYLDLIISIKLVDSVDEAIDHINHFGSHHTDCIVTENSETAAKFMQLVDSAGVYQNCSTRFADGFRYGFGAEVGISTGKLHARGPVGLDGLVTYKYKLVGDGHIVEDYSSGKKSFHFKNL
jgi:glutamate-5-semialdehyde dehydrogenase